MKKTKINMTKKEFFKSAEKKADEFMRVIRVLMGTAKDLDLIAEEYADEDVMKAVPDGISDKMKDVSKFLRDMINADNKALANADQLFEFESDEPKVVN